MADSRLPGDFRPANFQGAVELARDRLATDIGPQRQADDRQGYERRLDLRLPEQRGSHHGRRIHGLGAVQFDAEPEPIPVNRLANA